MKFYTTEKLGKKQSLTPEGFLLIVDVPIARTGQMIYGPDETPIKPSQDGYVRIERTPDEVFRDETVASFAGKPVTNDHPPEDVTPENWKQYDVGVVLNPRRGLGAEDDLLIADLLIKDPEAIEAVRSGKREVSAGYDAEYFETGAGRGEQRNIIANHVALVEEGRCGPRCAIGDRSFNAAPSFMEQSKMKIHDFLRRAFKAKDEKELEDIAKDAEGEMGGGSEQHVHVHLPGAGEPADKDGDDHRAHDDDPDDRLGALEKQHEQILSVLNTLIDRLNEMDEDTYEDEPEDQARDIEGFMASGAFHPIRGSKGYKRSAAGEGRRKRRRRHDSAMDDGEEGNREIEGDLEEEAPAGTGDRARKARDSVYLEDSFQETVALAEILAPGIRIPTFDRAASPKRSLDAICNLRRQALDLAYGQPDTRGFIDETNGGKAFDLKRMSCGAVRTLFRSIAAMKKKSNNSATGRTGDMQGSATTPRTLADINRMNRQRYKS